MTTNPPAPPASAVGDPAPQYAPPAEPPVTGRSTDAPAGTAKPPLRLFLVLLELGALGVVGTGVLGALVGWLGAGIGLVFAAGIGLVLLVGLVYAFFGLGWFEVARLNGLYGFELPPLRLRQRERPGFGGWLRALGRQAIDGRMWRVLAHFLLACVLGTLVLRMVQWLSWSAMTALAPLFTASSVETGWGASYPAVWAPLVGGLGAVAALAALWGIALLHRVLARAIVARPDREAELVEQVRTTTAQRTGAVRAADVERTRIERDLHDGIQPRLVSVGMTLGMAQQKIDTDPEAAKELIGEAHVSTKAAITELRQLARGIHASVLDDRGLDAALSALAGRSHIPVILDVRMDGRPPVVPGSAAGSAWRDAEAAVYFAIAESLTNAAKHSRASECRVIVRVRDGRTLWARVEDNGIGGARVLAGGGLDGIMNRILAAGGTARLDSPVGGPTSLEVSVPCAS